MKKITLTDATEALKSLFEVAKYGNHEDHESFYVTNENGGTTFFFNKFQYKHNEVIERLTAFFQDKIIENGQCRIDNMTLIWTTVHIEPRSSVVEDSYENAKTQ